MLNYSVVFSIEIRLFTKIIGIILSPTSNGSNIVMVSFSVVTMIDIAITIISNIV